MALCAIALTIRCYMRCPFWDEWELVSDIAKGARPWNWHWLWSQHNEHRVATTRLLVWLDVSAFGAKNVSLFVEMYLVQLLHWGFLCYAVERWTHFSRPLKRTIQGVFGFCLFNLVQGENLTWAFQVSFLLCIALATATLLLISFYERVPRLLLSCLGAVPLIAATNLSAGLLIGPIGLLLAWMKHVPRRYIIAIGLTFLASVLFYFHGYSNPDPSHSPMLAVRDPLNVVAYLLVYMDAGWIPFAHRYGVLGLASLIVFFALAIRGIRYRRRLTAFEYFCLFECAFVIAVATSTAAGRAHFGLWQAGSSRYQSFGMLYWAALFSLALITIEQNKPAWSRRARQTMLAWMVCSSVYTPLLWYAHSARSDKHLRACSVLMRDPTDVEAQRTLYFDAGTFPSALTLLRRVWGP